MKKLSLDELLVPNHIEKELTEGSTGIMQIIIPKQIHKHLQQLRCLNRVHLKALLPVRREEGDGGTCDWKEKS